jgi:hypothetical protein
VLVGVAAIVAAPRGGTHGRGPGRVGDVIPACLTPCWRQRAVPVRGGAGRGGRFFLLLVVDAAATDSGASLRFDARWGLAFQPSRRWPTAVPRRHRIRPVVQREVLAERAPVSVEGSSRTRPVGPPSAVAGGSTARARARDHRRVCEAYTCEAAGGCQRGAVSTTACDASCTNTQRSRGNGKD